MTEGLDYAAVIAGPDYDAALEAIEDSDRYYFTDGGSFILNTSPTPEPIWGEGDDVLLADGEALIIAGGQGLGKTTLVQQLALGRCGITEYAELLGYPITAGQGRVLYLAMDRPRQAARSFRRMVGEAMRGELDRRLAVWQGPPPFDIAKHPYVLADMCEKAAADTVIVDSLKDAAVGLSDDEVGAGYNRARQKAVASGVQVVEVHHNRKAQQGGGHRTPVLDDLYGSTWLPAGAGSVILLTGKPGDPIVDLHHVKQPLNEVGPLKVLHDHDAGRSTVWHAADIVSMAVTRPVSAVDVARVLFDTDKPSPAEKEKARRKLDRLERSGLLRMVDEGDQRTSTPRLWSAA